KQLCGHSNPPEAETESAEPPLFILADRGSRPSTDQQTTGIWYGRRPVQIFFSLSLRKTLPKRLWLPRMKLGRYRRVLNELDLADLCPPALSSDMEHMQTPGTKSHQPTVLVVEDDETVRDAMTRILV